MFLFSIIPFGKSTYTTSGFFLHKLICGIIKNIKEIKQMDTDFYTRWDFIGLSSDTKPTPEEDNRVTLGSTFYEADTSRLYFWTNDQWYRKTSDVQTNIERKMKW